jgi:signal-transduction protein with cAMP-binding, CBS, and nucleotidyltransferase domain
MRLPEDLAALKRAQPAQAAAMLRDGHTAAEVVAAINATNLDLHYQVLAEVLARQATPPPVPFALLAMGSLGRGESLLAPDQDNGFILEDYPDEAHGAVDAWFRPFAAELCAALAETGFVLCPGGVMAMNPLWRKTRSQWARQFELWAQRRSGAALLFADIFFDMRVVAGEAGWGQALSRHVVGVLEQHPALLAALAAQDSRFGVGLTFWGGFADDEPGPGTRTDLKLHGLMPLVAAARLSALAAGVTESATPARLRGLAARGQLGAAEAARLEAAFATLLDCVLRQQLADHAAGLRPGNLVDTAALPAPRRQELRAALRAVRGFAKSSFAGLTGQLW